MINHKERRSGRKEKQEKNEPSFGDSGKVDISLTGRRVFDIAQFTIQFSACHEIFGAHTKFSNDQNLQGPPCALTSTKMISDTTHTMAATHRRRMRPVRLLVPIKPTEPLGPIRPTRPLMQIRPSRPFRLV